MRWVVLVSFLTFPLCGFVTSDEAPAPPTAVVPSADPAEKTFEVQGLVMETADASLRLFRNDVSDPPLELDLRATPQTVYEGVDGLSKIERGCEVRVVIAGPIGAKQVEARRIRLVTTREEVAKNLRSAKLYTLTRHLAVTNLPDDIAREAGVASLHYEKRAADDQARPVSEPPTAA